MQEIKAQGIYPQRTSFGSTATKEESVAPKQEHKNHDGALILGLLGATAATVATIAYIKKGKGSKEAEKAKDAATDVASSAASSAKKIFGRLEPEKLEKEVFEPLKGFKGGKRQFAEKAYELLVKAHGLEGVAPEKITFSKVEIHKDDMDQGMFNYAEGSLKLAPKGLAEYSQGDILGALSHELHHFQQYADVVCVMGVDKFAKTANRNVMIGAVDLLMRDNPELKKGLDSGIEELSKLDKPQILEELKPDSEKDKVLLAEFFPEGMENISKEEIIKRMNIMAKINLAEEAKLPKENINKKFWENVVAKRGAKTSEEVDSDIKPLIADFEAGLNTQETAQDAYGFFAGQRDYFNNPFEVTAFDTQYHVVQAWQDFAGKNKLQVTPNKLDDERPVIELFDKIDKHLFKDFPEEKDRAAEFERLIGVTKVKNNTTKPKEVFSAIWDDLQKSK